MPLPPSLLLFLILLTSSHFHQAHSRKHTSPASLVLSMTHSRSLLASSNSCTTLQSLDMMEEPLRGFRDGYLISLNLGTPTQVVQAYIDTGSDLTWVPCGSMPFDCIDCDDYKNYKLSSTFSPSHSPSSIRDLCTSPLCTNIHSSDNSYDPCAIAGCCLSTILKGSCVRPCPSFSYTYGAGGVVIGSLARDTLRVHGGDPVATKEVSGFAFGCVGSAYREPIGIVGFGKGSLSLPSQLGFLHKGFSHCFLGFKFANNPNISSPLVVGELAISSKGASHFTPMLKSPTYPSYYYIGLEGISIGDGPNGSAIEVPLSLRAFDMEGNGGLLIDSGTTYTHLPEPLYSKLLSELASKIAYSRSSEDEDRTGFDLCYKVPILNNSSLDEFPLITLHFLSSVELVLPKENCFYAMSAPRDSLVVKCFLFQRMDDGDYGPSGVFGSFQQQNVEVVYDLQNERVGFQPMDCASSAAHHGLQPNKAE